MAASIDRRRTMWSLRVTVALLVVGLVGGVAALLQSTQSAARAGVADRFAARAALAGKFVSTYVGVAQSADDSIDALVHRADLGLYEAKAAGRNSVGTARISIRV